MTANRALQGTRREPSWLQSLRPAGRVAELESLGRMTRIPKSRIVLLFAFVFVSTLATSTVLNKKDGLRDPTFQQSSWGWPQPWLHTVVEDASYTKNGQRTQRQRILWSIRGA